jgi:hypothetical protein
VNASGANAEGRRQSAFFEYPAARMARPGSTSLDHFDPPHVVDAPITHFRSARTRHGTEQSAGHQ